MTPYEIIEKIFIQYHSELLAEIARADTMLGMKRIADAGKNLELALHATLSRVLPEWIGITRGIVVSSNCRANSEEVDLILYDKRYFPGLVVSHDSSGSDHLSYISIDVVLGVISVKKTLGREELKSAIKNIKSVIDLDRKPLKNQIHFDIPLGGAISFRKGQEVNRIFSCIVSFENKLFYRIENRIRRLRTNDEITKYFDSIAGEEWFDGAFVDLIYTVDGTLFFPIAVNEESKWERTTDITLLSMPKQSIRPYIVDGVAKSDSRLALAYTYDFDNAASALGQFIMYLQIYCSQLIKASPNFYTWFRQFIDPDVREMMTIRKIKTE